MLTLNDGRPELWQWDTGRTLSVDADCSQVHFSNKVFGRSVDVDVVDGFAVIPDILLQTDKELTAWAFVGTPENGYTKISKVFKINKRNKPADYVFTPTDQTTLNEILDRIEDLENRPSGDVSEEDIKNAVNDYLDKNPISVEEKDPTVPAWAKQPNKPKYTAADVGALPADTPIPEGVTDEQIQKAVDAYFTENPPEGGGIPIPSSAQVGQTIVVKAVDESGKPTEWEAADLPSGGEKKWELFGSNTLTEDVSDYIIGDMINNANSFVTKEYTELLILCSLKGHTSVTSKTSVNIQANTYDGGQSQSFTNFIPASGASSSWVVHAKMMAVGEIRISVGDRGQYATTTTTKWQILSDNMRAMSFIRYFRFAGAKFGAGSTIKIYGR